MTLEAIADSTIWIWRAHFGMAGSSNNLNVLDASPLAHKMLTGRFPPRLEYTINGTRRQKPYWLADGIYPRYPISVHIMSIPRTNKEKCLALRQEGQVKDVERSFGVLQDKWHIVAQPARFWLVSKMRLVMQASIVLNNMIVEELVKTDEELDEFYGIEVRGLT